MITKPLKEGKSTGCLFSLRYEMPGWAARKPKIFLMAINFSCASKRELHGWSRVFVSWQPDLTCPPLCPHARPCRSNQVHREKGRGWGAVNPGGRLCIGMRSTTDRDSHGHSCGETPCRCFKSEDHSISGGFLLPRGQKEKQQKGGAHTTLAGWSQVPRAPPCPHCQQGWERGFGVGVGCGKAGLSTRKIWAKDKETCLSWNQALQVGGAGRFPESWGSSPQRGHESGSSDRRAQLERGLQS